MPTVTIRNGSIVNRGVIEFTNPVDLQPGDLTIRPTLRAVTVTKLSGFSGSPKQPAKNFAPLPVQFANLGSSLKFQLGFYLPYDAVYGLFYQGEEIHTFSQLIGDLDHDGAVNQADYDRFVGSLDTAEGAETFEAGADFNDDGFVDTLDLYNGLRVFNAGTSWEW